MRTEKKAFIKNASALTCTIKDQNDIIVFKKGRIPYVPCTLIKNNGKHGWYIEYKYADPRTGILTRGIKRIKKEREQCETDEQAEAYILISVITPLNKQLASGWTPKGDLVEEQPKEETITSLLNAFLIDKQYLRQDTIRVYKSAAKYMTEFLKATNYVKLNIRDFGEKQSVQLRKFAKRKGMSGVTFNNYRRMWGAFFGWVIKVERINLNCNPISSFIDREKENYSPRETVSHDRDIDVMRWCMKNDEGLLLIISLVNGPSFFRIQEILRLKVGNIDFENNRIRIDNWQSKTSGTVKIMSAETKRMMIKFGVDTLPQEYFIINKEPTRYGKITVGRMPKNITTDKKVKEEMAKRLNRSTRDIEQELSRDGYLNTRDADYNWIKLRKSIDLPMECQLYSYRHRGISDLYASGYSRDQISQLTGHISDAFWHYVSSSAKGEIAEMLAQHCIPVSEIDNT